MDQRTAFFGATGGCANACLAFSLKEGFKAIALARTPSKLHNMLLSQGLSEETIRSNLTIVQGDVTDVAAVKKTLMFDNNLVSKIVFGIGAAPVFRLSFSPIAMDNPHICQQATESIVQALEEIYVEDPSLRRSRPLITAISSTGVTGTYDVPVGYQWLYGIILAEAHKDKRAMEELLQADTNKDESARVFGGFVIVRPTLLVGDQNMAALDGKTLRVGTQESPAIGYTVHRAAVGRWIFDEVIRKNEMSWVGKTVSLTY